MASGVRTSTASPNRSSTSTTDLTGSVTEYQITTVTLTGTLSLVMVSCFSTHAVTMRMSSVRCHSISGMIQ